MRCATSSTLHIPSDSARWDFNIERTAIWCCCAQFVGTHNASTIGRSSRIQIYNLIAIKHDWSSRTKYGLYKTKKRDLYLCLYSLLWLYRWVFVCKRTVLCRNPFVSGASWEFIATTLAWFPRQIMFNCVLRWWYRSSFFVFNMWIKTLYYI